MTLTMRRQILKAIRGNRCIKRLFPAFFLGVTISVFLILYSIKRSLIGSASALKHKGSANRGVEHEKSLSEIFIDKLLDLEPEKLPTTACSDMKTPCERLLEVLATRNSSLGPYLDVMDRFAELVRPNRLLFVSASSESHFERLKELISSVHSHLFPRLDNFTFVIYDLGLTPEQRKMTQMLCNCIVLDFPFSSLPDFFSELHCYTWKPLIINVLLKKSKFTVWMDTSVRWLPGAPLDEILQLLEKQGVLLGISGDASIAMRTRPSMFEFYGDRACQYHAFPEMYATYILLHNEPFIRQALMEPWVSCAFSRECMCIPNHMSWLKCYHTLPRLEGVCHRFDQSSLTIILTKLYLDRSHELKFPEGMLDIL